MNPFPRAANNLQTMSELLNHQHSPSMKSEYLSSVAYFEVYECNEWHWVQRVILCSYFKSNGICATQDITLQYTVV